jgi:hypothetical protein
MAGDRNNSDKGLLLHVGLPKTGTTTIQRAFFECHPEIFYLGKIVKNNPTAKRCRNQEVYEILRKILWLVDRPFNHLAAQKKLQNLLLDGSPSQRLVGSWEELGNRSTKNHVKMLSRIGAVFGSCRIIYVLRNPLTQLPSEYLQDLKGHFIMHNHLWMGMRNYLDIEDWFEKKIKLKTAHTILNYVECIRASVELLGKENVGVFLFDDLLNDSRNYYRAVSRFIGVEEEIAVELCERSHFHPRITQSQVGFLQQISTSVLQTVAFAARSQQHRRRLFLSKDDSVPAKAVLNDRIAGAVAEATREGHRWLVDTYNLPLGQYGYPL